MARSDSFFIRASVTETATDTYKQESIDLGSFVDALGKSVLRIHNIAVSFTDENGRSPDMSVGEAAAQFQLVTQSQADIVLPSNRSIIASGMVNASATAAGVAGNVSHDLDNLPQMWTNGYLVAVSEIFLGTSASAKWSEDVTCSIVMECTVETMTQAAAMALALSQQ